MCGKEEGSGSARAWRDGEKGKRESEGQEWRKKDIPGR